MWSSRKHIVGTTPRILIAALACLHFDTFDKDVCSPQLGEQADRTYDHATDNLKNSTSHETQAKTKELSTLNRLEIDIALKY